MARFQIFVPIIRLLQRFSIIHIQARLFQLKGCKISIVISVLNCPHEVVRTSICSPPHILVRVVGGIEPI